MRRALLVALLGWYFSVYPPDAKMWLGPLRTYGPYDTLGLCLLASNSLEWGTQGYTWAPSVNGRVAVQTIYVGLIVGLCEHHD